MATIDFGPEAIRQLRDVVRQVLKEELLINSAAIHGQPVQTDELILGKVNTSSGGKTGADGVFKVGDSTSTINAYVRGQSIYDTTEEVILAVIGGRLEAIRYPLPLQYIAGGRLQSDGTTCYYVCERGRQVAVYHEGVWTPVSATDGATGITGSILSASTRYSVYGYLDTGADPSTGGGLGLEASTTHPDGTKQDGVIVKPSDPTRRYLGAIYTDGSKVINDSQTKRHVANFNNRIMKRVAGGSLPSGTDTTASWTTADSISVLKPYYETSYGLSNPSMGTIWFTAAGKDSAKIRINGGTEVIITALTDYASTTIQSNIMQSGSSPETIEAEFHANGGTLNWDNGVVFEGWVWV